MNNVSKFAKLAGVLVLGAAAPLAFGLTTPKAYIESYHGRTDIPVPVKVVAPDAAPSQAGATAQLEFVVDALGRPQDVRVISATDYAFGSTAREAVSRWKFKPATRNGEPVSMKVALPVVVSESD